MKFLGCEYKVKKYFYNGEVNKANGVYNNYWIEGAPMPLTTMATMKQEMFQPVVYSDCNKPKLKKESRCWGESGITVIGSGTG